MNENELLTYLLNSKKKHFVLMASKYLFVRLIFVFNFFYLEFESQLDFHLFIWPRVLILLYSVGDRFGR